MKNEITLYSRDNKGKILVWNCYILTKKDSCSLSISRGELNGAKVLSWEHNIIGKQGRDNYEQAQSRLKSRANLKKRRGYIELTPEQQLAYNNSQGSELILSSFIPKYRQDAEGNAKPMKAAQYYRAKQDKTRDKNGKLVSLGYWTDPYGIRWKDRKYFYLKNPNEPKEKGAIIADFTKKEYSAQPKINGVRSTIKLENDIAVIRSKDGLIYNAPNHIINWCNENKDIFGDEGDLILDGELYIYGESLQTIQSAVKSFDFNTPRVVFILFDIAIENFTNIQRWQHIKNEIRLDLNSPIERIKTFKVRSDKEAQYLCDKFIKEGHEGVIIREKSAMYGFGSRKNNMLKLKRVISEDFTIKRIIPQPKGQGGMFICTHKGKEFKINPTFSDSEKALLLLNPSNYIGKKLQTTFYEWTLEEKPLHIIETIIRDYE